MPNKLGKFRIDYSIHGAAVVATSERLTVNCLADGEIDHEIERLKKELDACGREMKRQARAHRDNVFLGRAEAD